MSNADGIDELVTGRLAVLRPFNARKFRAATYTESRRVSSSASSYKADNDNGGHRGN